MKSFGIAVATWFETVRQPAFFVVVLVTSLLLFGSSWITLSGFVEGREGQIIRETGVAGAVMGGLLLVFLTVPGVISEEIRTRQMLAIRVKPISGFELALGKFFGTAFALALAFAVFAAAFGASLWLNEGVLPVRGILGAFFLGFLQSCILAALVLLFSISLPIPAAVLCGFLVFAAGNLFPLLAKKIEVLGFAGFWGGQFALLWIPNLFRLNAAFDFAAGRDPSLLYLLTVCAYFSVYLLMVLLIAGRLIARKEMA